MNRQFIPDREIVLSKDTDLLNTSTYADNLTNLIRHAPKEQVFTIGLFGSWGSGKSSVIETSKKSLTCSEDVKSSLLHMMRGNMQMTPLDACSYFVFNKN